MVWVVAVAVMVMVQAMRMAADECGQHGYGSDTVHTFCNAGPSPAKLLAIVSP